MLTAKMPITATPRMMSSVAMRGARLGSVAQSSGCSPLPNWQSLISDWGAERGRVRSSKARRGPLGIFLVPGTCLAPTPRPSRLRRLALELDVIRQAHALDQLELGFEEVDVGFLALQDAIRTIRG